jgi:hypothetical protein
MHRRRCVQEMAVKRRSVGNPTEGLGTGGLALTVRMLAIVALGTCLLGTIVPAEASGGHSGVCRPLIVDDAGDATATDPTTGHNLIGVYSDPALDLLSADLAADRRLLTLVVRTAGDMRDAVTSKGGHAVELLFTAIGESQWDLAANLPSTGGVHAFLGRVDQNRAVGGEGVLSPDGKTLRITIPRLAFEELSGHALSTGSQLSQLRLLAARGAVADFAAAFPPGSADEARTSAIYRVGAPSCVTPT